MRLVHGWIRKDLLNLPNGRRKFCAKGLSAKLLLSPVLFCRARIARLWGMGYPFPFFPSKSTTRPGNNQTLDSQGFTHNWIQGCLCTFNEEHFSGPTEEFCKSRGMTEFISPVGAQAPPLSSLPDSPIIHLWKTSVQFQ